MKSLAVVALLLIAWPASASAQWWRPDVTGHIAQFDKVAVGHADLGMHSNVLFPIGSLTNRGATPDLWSGYGYATMYGSVIGPYFGVSSDTLGTATALSTWVLLSSDGRPRRVSEVSGIQTEGYTRTDPLVTVDTSIALKVWYTQDATTNWGIYARPYLGYGANMLGGTTYAEHLQLFDGHRWVPVTVGAPDSCGIGRRCVSVAN